MNRKLLLLTLVSLIVGCTTLPVPIVASNKPDMQRCSTLADRGTVFGAVAAGTSLLSGASGGITAFTDDDTKNVRIGLAITAGVLAAAAAATLYVSHESTVTWAKEGCGVVAIVDVPVVVSTPVSIPTPTPVPAPVPTPTPALPKASLTP